MEKEKSNDFHALRRVICDIAFSLTSRTLIFGSEIIFLQIVHLNFCLSQIVKKCISAFQLNLRLAVVVCRAKFSKVVKNAQNPVENWLQKKIFSWFALNNYSGNP